MAWKRAKLPENYNYAVFQCGLPSGIPVYWQNLVWRSLGQVTSQHATPNVYNWYGDSCLS